MSGGSFNYLCFKTDSGEIFDLVNIEQLGKMEAYLRGLGYALAADEVYKFKLEIETARRHIEIMGERLHPLLYATEWCASGDSGQAGIEKAMDKLLGKGQ
jgi:hypothetical protein